MKAVKGLTKRGSKIFFRVCLDVYGEDSVKRIFGEGKKEGRYLFFESELSEEEIYAKFARLVEDEVNGWPFGIE